MRQAWARAGLRARLAVSIGVIVIVAFAVLFVAVRRELADESAAIERGERQAGALSIERGGSGGDARGELAEIRDAQTEVVRTLVLVGAGALGAALLAGYMLADRTAAPLRHMASTAAAVDAGDLSPRIGPLKGAPIELRTLSEAFDHMLDRLDDAFSRQRQFASDASHELRTPLTAIRGQIEVLARAESPRKEDVRRVEEITLTELERLDGLVDDLLTLAKLDEMGSLQIEQVDLRRFLGALRDGGTEGTAVLAEEAPDGALSADPARLTQVIRNLEANAWRHAGPQGHVSVSAVADSMRLVIRVDDDGPGIDPHERERVFARFHRSEEGRDRASGGSGLGLAIARSIVELHGGRIWVEGSPAGGARVAFELEGFEPQLGIA
jgi:signal transduction histidine kinase